MINFGQKMMKKDINNRAEGAKIFLRKFVKIIRGDPFDFFRASRGMGGG
jgi:hypothetical protein